MNRRYIRIGVSVALAAVTLGVAAPMAAAQEHRNSERTFQSVAVRASSDVTTHAEFVNYLNSAEGQALIAEAELTAAEREALYSSDTTTEAVVQHRLSGIIKLLKKVKGWAAAAKSSYSKFKVWYADKVPAALRWAIKWGFDLYTIYQILRGMA